MLRKILIGATLITLLSGCGEALKVEEPTRVIHEYLDLNENGKYEFHRVVFEKGNEREIYATSYFDSREFTKEELKRIPWQGYEQRFL